MFAHRLEVGGTQVNAIELAAGLRDYHGCEVTLFATPGPMVEVARTKNLRFVAAPDAAIHPSPARMKALRKLVQTERPDLVHAWDWWQCLDAYYSVYLPWGIPLLTTDMMPTVARVLPKQVPTTFGTPEVVDIALASGRQHAELMLPPVDIHANAPNTVDSEAFKAEHGLKDGHINIVTVSRLDEWMKSESLIRTIQAVRSLGRELPIRFVVVGDGAARAKLEELAQETNVMLGRRAVVMTGALLDPRPAYAAADIIVGMGGSALRGMAFAKPVIVVGAAGFSAIFNASTAERFYYTGMYGIGDNSVDPGLLAQQIRELLQNHDQLPMLGQGGRRFVEEHFALEVVCQRLFELCHRVTSAGVPRGKALRDAVRTSAVYIRERRFLCRSRDKKPVDRVADSTLSAAHA